MFSRIFTAMSRKLDKEAVKYFIKNVDNYMFDCDGKGYKNI